MSILYFLIADKQNGKRIGHFMNNILLSDEGIEEIEKKATELLLLSTVIDKSQRYKVQLEHIIIFYSLCLPSTLYILAVNKDSPFIKQDNLIFELIEDVDSQGIRKLVDKQGKLTKVALQNLRYAIDKYQSLNKIDDEKASIFDHFHSTENNDDKRHDEDENPKIEVSSAIINEKPNNEIEEITQPSIDIQEIIKQDSIIHNQPPKVIKKQVKYAFIGVIILIVCLALFVIYHK